MREWNWFTLGSVLALAVMIGLAFTLGPLSGWPVLAALTAIVLSVLGVVRALDT